MPWFPEFGYAMKMAAEGRAAEVSANAVRSYIESVHSGVPELGRSPEEQIVLHDPRAGRVEGSVAFKEFVESSSKWLAEANARTEWVASTATPGRAVGELIAYLTIDADFQCPFCGKFARETEPELIERYVDTGVLRL